MGRDTRRRPWVALATFLIVQAVLGCWWAAFYPGLFSRDSVLYLSHTMVGPWVSDHSVVYDALLWLSFTKTGDLGAVTFAQTTAMAGALTYLAQSLKAMGAPRLLTTVVVVLMPLAPPVGAFTVTLWKDVPFTICAVAIAGLCARIAARRAVGVPALAGLALLFVALGLFRANGFLIAGVAVLALVVLVPAVRLRLLLTGTLAAALPLVLSNVVFPQFGIVAPSKTYVYHTAYGDIAVAYRQRPDLFTPRDISLMSAVAPIERWWEGGTCYTINPLIWRKDFSWPQADLHAGELLELWRRLLVTEPRLVVDARLCRGAIAWRPVQDEQVTGGMTYRFSRRPNADTYVGPDKVADFPGRWVYSLRPLSLELNQVADPWLTGALMPEWDWVLWRGRRGRTCRTWRWGWGRGRCATGTCWGWRPWWPGSSSPCWPTSRRRTSVTWPRRSSSGRCWCRCSWGAWCGCRRRQGRRCGGASTGGPRRCRPRRTPARGRAAAPP